MKGKQARTLTNQITEGVIWKQLLLFFFPILFGTFFQQLYNTTDAVIVGNFVGKEALAAVGGPAAMIINLLVGFFVGLSSGAGVVISQFYGSGKREKLIRAVHTAIALSIVGGGIMMILGIVSAEAALRAMSTPEDILEQSISYMRIYFLGMIPSMLYNMGSAILRAVGDSRRPLYFLMASCLVNIVLDLFFVVALGLGVVGVGIATALSQVVSASMTLFVLLRTKETFRVVPKWVRMNRRMLTTILKIGLPAGLQSAMYSISNILIQSSINSFGTDTVAAWTAYSKIDSVFWLILSAYGISITTFAGQNFGAGKLDRVFKSVRVCLGMAALTSVLFSLLVWYEGGFIAQLFTKDASVLQICVQMMRAICPAYITYIFIEILSGACRGCGDAFRPMVLTSLGICALRILWVFIAVPIRHEITTITFSYPLTWVVTSVLFIIYYKRGKWINYYELGHR